MQFNIISVNVSRAIAESRQPVFSLERPQAGGSNRQAVYGQSKVGRTGNFWVPISPVNEADGVTWSNTSQGELVRVPLLAYDLTEDEKSDVAVQLVAAGAELGIRARHSLEAYANVVPVATTLLLGNVCEQRPAKNTGGSNKYRYYLGFMFQVE